MIDNGALLVFVCVCHYQAGFWHVFDCSVNLLKKDFCPPGKLQVTMVDPSPKNPWSLRCGLGGNVWYYMDLHRIPAACQRAPMMLTIVKSIHDIPELAEPKVCCCWFWLLALPAGAWPSVQTDKNRAPFKHRWTEHGDMGRFATSFHPKCRDAKMPFRDLTPEFLRWGNWKLENSWGHDISVLLMFLYMPYGPYASFIELNQCLTKAERLQWFAEPEVSAKRYTCVLVCPTQESCVKHPWSINCLSRIRLHVVVRSISVLDGGEFLHCLVQHSQNRNYALFWSVDSILIRSCDFRFWYCNALFLDPWAGKNTIQRNRMDLSNSLR